MSNNALYFPYIAVPNNEWLMHVLLYWDKLCSIVPSEYFDNPEKLPPHMRELVAAELVEQIMPNQYLHTIENFEENFIKCLEKRMKRANYQRASKTPTFSDLHMEKLGAELPRWLIDHKLAMRDRSSWFKVESNVANMFMSYLAAVLGGLPAVNAAPITDSDVCAGILGYSKFAIAGKIHQSRNYDILQQSRNDILRKLLPVPAKGISLDSLLKFKNQNKRLLPAFRRSIETYCAELAEITKDKQRAARAKSIVHSLEQQGAEIEDAMKTSWGKIVFKGLAPLIASGGAWWGTYSTRNPALIAAATISVLAAAYSALSSVRRPKEYLRKPLAYYGLARKALLKP